MMLTMPVDYLFLTNVGSSEADAVTAAEHICHVLVFTLLLFMVGLDATTHIKLLCAINMGCVVERWSRNDGGEMTVTQ